MGERPILFKPEMVRAILAGRKTQTRRALKPQPGPGQYAAMYSTAHVDWQVRNKYGIVLSNEKLRFAAGDTLWVRETWRPLDGYSIWDLRVRYAADNTEVHFQDGDVDVGDWRFPKAAKTGWVTPLHMPRWASRLTLSVTDVRVERLQDISNDDVEAEGAAYCDNCGGVGWINTGPDGGHQCTAPGCGDAYTDCFQRLWQSINTKPGVRWEDNPWVAAVSFHPTPTQQSE